MSGARETARDAAREGPDFIALIDQFQKAALTWEEISKRPDAARIRVETHKAYIEAKSRLIAAYMVDVRNASLDAFTRSTGEGWQSFPAPSLDRIIVAGWQTSSGNVPGYWWYYEDMADQNGKPIDHPDAIRWRPFPAPPAHPPAQQPLHAKEEQR